MGEQLNEAALLLAVGMVVVFGFLTMLIGGIKAITWFANVTAKDEAHPQTPQSLRIQNNNKTTTVNPDIVAAIGAAVHLHQHKHK
ncbi:OadG family transporter subunit [Glaciecola sp. XM2]|uniref:OadG family protein n=1 Tax=Glaciecola sp. XM2 TaxID=1914931 RepID=UPI0020327247|nr:OadG family transporter subunit [Glaciecola sp. XM2]